MNLHPGAGRPGVGVRLRDGAKHAEVDTSSARRALQLGNAKVPSTAHPGLSLLCSSAVIRASSSIVSIVNVTPAARDLIFANLTDAQH
jgi:hypothetical protein